MPTRLNPRPPRRRDLDWVRLVAVLTVVILHVSMAYVSYPVRTGEAVPLPGVALFNAATHPWRMALLFLVSGVVSRHLLHGRKPAAFVRERFGRLVPPLVLGVLVLIPAQYYVALSSASAPTSYWAVWAAYIGIDELIPIAGAVDIPMDISHLWFIFYLALYVGVAGLLARIPGLLATLSGLIDRMSAGVVLALPLTFLIAMRLWVYPAFAGATGVFDDVYRHIVFGTLFLFGFAAAPADRFWDRIVALRWIGLSLAVPAFALFGFLTLTVGRGDGALAEATSPILHVVRPFEVWGAICAVLGFARRHLAGPSTPVLAACTPAVMTIYLLHPMALVLVRAGLGTGPAWCMGFVVVAVLAICLAAHAAIRRVGWLRYAFGLGMARTASTRPTAGQRLASNAHPPLAPALLPPFEGAGDDRSLSPAGPR